jgi:hypothetical protein
MPVIRATMRGGEEGEGREEGEGGVSVMEERWEWTGKAVRSLTQEEKGEEEKKDEKRKERKMTSKLTGILTSFSSSPFSPFSPTLSCPFFLPSPFLTLLTSLPLSPHPYSPPFHSSPFSLLLTLPPPLYVEL